MLILNKRLVIFQLLATVVMVVVLTSCKKDFLSKSDKNALFAEPTTTELNNIFSDWQSRNLTPTDYTIIQQEDILSGKFKLKIVSFKVNNIKEYGALVVPSTISKVPVQVFVGGFGLNLTTNSVNIALDNANTADAHLLAIPALRGQSLEITINGTVYKSPLSEGNQCDAFDGATDDVLAFLNLIQQTEAFADVNRTGVRGGSRGGTVALLAGIRDARVKRVIGVACPTNLFELTSQSENDATYQCQFLSGFKNGQATLAETRNKMLASSPIYFAKHLPLGQLHLGLQDRIVPVKQGYDLEKEIEKQGNAATFQLFTYDKTHNDIATDNTELAERTKAFFSQL